MAVLVQGQPAAVMNQKTTGARELVSLFGKHPHDEFLTGEVGSGQLEGIRRVNVIDIERRCSGVGARTSGQLVERLVRLGLDNTWGVVISGHDAGSFLYRPATRKRHRTALCSRTRRPINVIAAKNVQPGLAAWWSGNRADV